jgi:hypothetical protein
MGGDDRDDQDRQLDELLSELRIVLPGVTVLFAFLLSLPFTARFGALDRSQRAAYFVAFMASAISIVLLVAEVGYHRLRGRPYDKEQMITTTARQTVAAVGSLGVALVAVVYLVSDVVYPTSLATGVAVGVALLALASWVAVPVARRRRGT